LGILEWISGAGPMRTFEDEVRLDLIEELTREL
jgi:hypothetical protein